MRSILIKDTTREERIQIVNQALNVCGQECGLVDAYYQPYIDGKKEIRELNAEYRPGLVR